jgi:predicted oxidoreductase
VTGTGRIDGLREAVAALDVRVSAEEWYAVWRAAQGREVP